VEKKKKKKTRVLHCDKNNNSSKLHGNYGSDWTAMHKPHLQQLFT